MADKKNPGIRRAREAARRAAAAQRIGPRPVKTPRARQPKYLYDLKPPGIYYREWEAPTGTDEEVMNKVIDIFGPDSGETLTMRFMLDYREIYGPHIPLAAARHLDQILTSTDLAAQIIESIGATPEEARDSLHSLHAQGMLLIADDGSLWMTVPPGTPYSALNGEWAFVEKKMDAPEETAIG